MTDGKFIVLDGPEGCGKSTQAALLAKHLEAQGQQVLLVRDPGTTRIGERVRGILLDPDHAEMNMRCEMLLYMAARAQMMSQSILPALAAGKTVICDRFVSSTLAYQLGGDGLSAGEIRAVADIAIRGRWPDLTIILDIATKTGNKRTRRAPGSPEGSQSVFTWYRFERREKDRIEQRPSAYFEQVRRNYLAQAAAGPAHYRVIDAGRAVEVVAGDIVAAVSSGS